MNYEPLKVSELRQLVRKRNLASGLAVAGARKDTLIQALTDDRWPSKVETDATTDGDLVSAYLETLELARTGDTSERLYSLQGRVVAALARMERRP